MSPTLHSAITDVYVDNEAVMSDHFPLFVAIDFHGLPKGTSESDQNERKIKWNFADQAKVNTFYEKLINEFDFNLISDFCFCRGSCVEPSHWANIEARWSEFVRVINRCGDHVFGRTKNKTKIIPGWNEHIKHLYQKAREAFRAWKREGSPRHGEEAQRMRISRAAFKYAIRRCRQDEESMRAQAMSRKLREGDVRSFWRCAGTRGAAAVRPDRIDGAVGERNIANLWASKFNTVLNSVQDEKHRKEFYALHIGYGEIDVEHVTLTEISNIVRKMEDNKAVGLDNIPNEFYSRSPRNILIFISMKTNAFIIHEYLPEDITNSKIIPILKGKMLDFTVSDNYRPVTISTLYSKIFESIIYNRIHERFETEDNQFGYKRSISTEMCIMTLKETVRSYLKQNSPVFACYIDVKGAFDRVSYFKLFSKLIARGVPKKIINILKFWYVNQALCVGWGSTLSYVFHMCNGIKQGSIMSPYLYSIFTDSLSTQLNECRSGCHIGQDPQNNLSWADDLVIIAPSSHSICDMLVICDRFAKDHLVIFNTKKTKCMLFNSNNSVINKPKITLSGKVIEFVEKFTYLGHIISNDLKDDDDIGNQNRKMCARGNMVIRKYKSASVEVKCMLFRSFCYNVYGMALWSCYKGSTLNKLRVNYNNVARRLFHRPPWSSASELFVEHRLKGFYEIRRNSCYSLRSRVLSSRNSLVQRIVNCDARWRSPLWQKWEWLLAVPNRD